MLAVSFKLLPVPSLIALLFEVWSEDTVTGEPESQNELIRGPGGDGPGGQGKSQIDGLPSILKQASCGHGIVNRAAPLENRAPPQKSSLRGHTRIIHRAGQK